MIAVTTVLGLGTAASGAPAAAAVERPAAVARPAGASAAATTLAGETRKGDTRPVVFVHGLNADPGVWSSMEGKFEKDPAGDFPASKLHTFDYSHTTKERIANNSKRFSDWLSSQQLGEVDVVAHSLGGLVARKAQEDGSKIRRIITLATPNHGTGCCSVIQIAWPVCQDMERTFGKESSFLKNLNEKAHITQDTVMTYAVTTDDGQVAADSVHLDKALNKIVDPSIKGGSCTNPSVHNSILYNDTVATDSMNFLRYGSSGVTH
ncbi:esterase/lipase family protein [Kitasatospora brasiliensis]|uniref:esterase/lipase family protein n=1 Tax=Kitasatospora brasiliensis TaxID=3058040 RepID=UPI00293139B8|nr:hypothetical protein [Kitasatospora sp. K002]